MTIRSWIQQPINKCSITISRIILLSITRTDLKDCFLAQESLRILIHHWATKVWRLLKFKTLILMKRESNLHIIMRQLFQSHRLTDREKRSLFWVPWINSSDQWSLVPSCMQILHRHQWTQKRDTIWGKATPRALRIEILSSISPHKKVAYIVPSNMAKSDQARLFLNSPTHNSRLFLKR